jgi:hypothetical protein
MKKHNSRKEFDTPEQRETFIHYLIQLSLKPDRAYQKLVYLLDYQNGKFVVEY